MVPLLGIHLLLLHLLLLTVLREDVKGVSLLLLPLPTLKKGVPPKRTRGESEVRLPLSPPRQRLRWMDERALTRRQQ